MAIQSYNNFLDNASYHKLYDILFGQSFPWYFYEASVDIYDNSPSVLRHCFIKEEQNNSSWTEILKELFQKISETLETDISFISAHANLSFPSSENYTACPHIDSDQFDDNCYTAIYYLHDVDGDTTVYNQTAKTNNEIDISILTPQLTVTPEANRLVVWPAATIHTAPPTSSKPRIVVNLNFRVSNGI
jgi:hypothetical protein